MEKRAMTSFLDPTAELAPQARAPLPKRDSLAGLKVALLDISKPLARSHDAMQSRHSPESLRLNSSSRSPRNVMSLSKPWPTEDLVRRAVCMTSWI
jgi:hypothetical protein